MNEDSMAGEKARLRAEAKARRPADAPAGPVWRLQDHKLDLA